MTVSEHFVADDAALRDVVNDAMSAPLYALDTEFHRERTYFPRLALVQLQWGKTNVLIDPLAVDPRGLADLLRGSGLAVLHASQQDLEVLRYAVGEVPSRLFDTQLAAGFIGYSTPSLAALAQSQLKVTLSKGDRMTDWLRRPLTESQCSYARSDVAYLEQLFERISGRVDQLGRTTWVNEACEELRVRPWGESNPADAWLRIKDARALKGEARGVAQALAAWRERRAMATNIPLRRVMSDMALLGIAQAAPRSTEDLAHARGVDERYLSGSIAREILAAVKEGRERVVELDTQAHDPLEKRLRPAVTLVTAWIGELARTAEIDPTLVATNRDIVALLAGGESRLAHGWRRDLVGRDIERLLKGESGLSFDGDGRLRLIPAKDADAQ
ncbi:MAG: putative ribonuclease [Actinomycetota bacterium]|nr:HRDC domain-containing protein [Ilumatobacteraceae bacterium]